jgi:carbon-monoxide dehydrogenase large subunit
MIVEGQVHGGLAQGVGQALCEHIVYDPDSGQLLTGSFMDYAMPRATDLPSFHTAFIATPAPSNPMGVKGGSESGAIGAPAAIGNAVIDALWHLGVRDISLPVTSETVWRALRDAAMRRDSEDAELIVAPTAPDHDRSPAMKVDVTP